MSKLYLLKDQSDLEFYLTDDPIINIIGTKGSGKTTSSVKYLHDDSMIVVNCDRLLELPCDEKEDKELTRIREFLKEKYDTIPEGEKFVSCYHDIVDYILKNKKKGIIEGNLLQDIDSKELKGKVIVKRTGVLKSFFRAVKRDYKNEYFMNLEKENHKYFYKITRFFHITNRRKSVFQQAREIEKIMDTLGGTKDL